MRSLSPHSHRTARRFRPLPLLPLFLAWAAPTRAAITHDWLGLSGGEWNDPANWATGLVPNTAGDIAAFSNPAAAGTALAIRLSGSPFIVGEITAANTDPANVVVLGSAESGDDVLPLATPEGTPGITVSSGTLVLNAQLAGNQGFLKSGPGTLSFIGNPHAQTFTGPVTLAGGTLKIGADQDLGAADNDITVGNSATLLASPVPNAPVVLGSGRGIIHPHALTSSVTLTLGNAADNGSLEIAGPVSGTGPYAFNGIGTLSLSGVNTFSGPLIYTALPAGLTDGVSRVSRLRLVGPGALRSAGNGFSMEYSGAYVTNSTITSQLDLGGLPRTITNLSFAPNLSSGSSNSTLATEFLNGSLVIGRSGTVDVSARGSGMQVELRLPESAQVFSGNLQIGNTASSNAAKLNSSRLRIGTSATFYCSGSLLVGYNGASGRLDALAPGSVFKLSGGNSASPSRVRMNLGNGAQVYAPGHEAVIDLENGSVDILANTITIHGSRSDHPTAAALKFGSGVVDATSLFLGGGGSQGQLLCSVVQRGGTARYGTMSFGNAYISSGTLGNVSFVYELSGGRLAVGNVTALGNATLRPACSLAWSGGTLQNHPDAASQVLFSGPYGTPIDIVLSGPDAKTIEVDSGKTVTFGSGVNLSSASADVLLTKTGSGTLILGGNSAGFTGTLQHDDGGLSFGYSAATGTALGLAQAGALLWNKGAFSFDLSSSGQDSDRLVLTRTLTKGPGLAQTRILTLKNSLGSGTYTLATYASTDLTLADFVAYGVRPGYSAEFLVGPNALTVTLSPETAYTAWRRSKFNAGAANTELAADTADPDADGRPNLLEYALGANPLASDPSSDPLPSLTPSLPHSLQLTFRRIADPALTYTVRASTDLAGPWDEVVFTSTGPDNTDGPITVTDTASLDGRPLRFLRLFVTR